MLNQYLVNSSEILKLNVDLINININLNILGFEKKREQGIIFDDLQIILRTASDTSFQAKT